MPLVIHSPEAAQDLHENWDFIAQNNRPAADRMIDMFASKAELVATQPEMGQVRTEIAEGQFRSYLVGEYLFYYHPISDGILIVRVLHGSREHRRLF